MHFNKVFGNIHHFLVIIFEIGIYIYIMVLLQELFFNLIFLH